MALPKVSPDALKEACKIFASEQEPLVDKEKYMTYIKSINDKLSKEQPYLYEYLKNILEYHSNETQGMCPAYGIIFYCSIIINSLIIQAEIDDIDKLFNSN